MHHPTKDLTSAQAQLIQLGNLVAIGYHTSLDLITQHLLFQVDQLSMAISGQLLTQPIVSLQLPANPSFKNILRDWRCVNQHLKTVALSRTVSRHGCIVTAEN